MAVEVLERGTPPTERVYESSCSTCKSKLRFRKSDAELVSVPRPGESYLRLRCPVCSGLVYADP